MNNKIIRILLIAESFWSFGSGLFLPIFAIYSSRVGGDILDAGIAAAIFLFVTSIFEYPVGKLLDIYKEKWFLIADYFLEAIVFIGYIFVHNIYQLFLLQIILGIAGAMGDPSWESLYDKSTSHKGSGSFWANSHLCIGVFGSIGMAIGVYVVKVFGFSVVFMFGAIFSVIAGIVVIKYVKTN